MNHTLHVALAQIAPVWLDKAKTTEKIIKLDVQGQSWSFLVKGCCRVIRFGCR